MFNVSVLPGKRCQMSCRAGILYYIRKTPKLKGLQAIVTGDNRDLPPLNITERVDLTEVDTAINSTPPSTTGLPAYL